MPRSGQRLTPVKEGFHTTIHNITNGEVLPSSAHDNVVFPNMSSTTDTYFTPIHESEASAEIAQNERGDEFPKEALGRATAEDIAWQWGTMIRGQSRGQSRARVHVTEPDEEQYADKNGAFLGARVAPKQRIKDTLWGPRPKSDRESVEMTLPHVNWSQVGPGRLYPREEGPVDQSRLRLGPRNDDPLPNWVEHHVGKEDVVHRHDNGFTATVTPRQDAWNRGASDAQSKVDWEMSGPDRLMSMPDTEGIQQRLWYGKER